MKRLLGFLSLLLVVALVFSSCKKKENEQPPVPVEDGYYLVGGSAPIDSMMLKTMMDQGYVEGEGFSAQAMDGLYQKYVYLTANGGGFVIKEQAGADRRVWGMDGNWTQVVGDTVMKATMKKDGANFTVPKDGFYLVVADFNTNTLYLLRAEYWGLIGDATPGGWSADTKMTTVKVDKDGGEWTVENVLLMKASLKFRFNSWWTYYSADPNAEGNGDPKFFTNLGGSLDDLTPGGANIPVDQAGIYNVTLKYTYGGKFTATLDYVGQPPLDDFSDDTVSLIGSGIGTIQNGSFVEVAGWTEDIDLAYTGVQNDVYSFEIDSFAVSNGGEFKFRLNHSWDRNWGYEDVTLQGDVDSIVNAAGKGNNFKSTANAEYKVVFAYDGRAYTATVTFTYKGGFTPPTPPTPDYHTISFIGSAFYVNNDTTQAQTNWDSDLDMTYNGQDANGNYQFVYNGLHFIGGGEFKLRKDHDWGTNWGMGNTTVTGDGASNISGTDNFVVGSDATYNCTFTIDANYGNATLDLANAK